MTPNSVILKTREDAEKVLETMVAIAKRYDYTAVGDLYDLVGLPSTYLDTKAGWRENTLANVEINQIEEGYVIKFPEPLPQEVINQLKEKS